MKDSSKFYIATAIPYSYAHPHIGNIYEIILADSIARLKRKQGLSVFFQTGSDDHGQKIGEMAAKLNIDPQDLVDDISNKIKEIYKLVDISYDKFIRTTDKEHMKIVQNMFEYMLEKGDIYKGKYEGPYCVSCESFFTEKDLVDGKCPDCNKEIKYHKEEAYFLNLKKYQDRLVKYINEHDDFITPVSRKNEIMNYFLKEPLKDLCITRNKDIFGIPLKSDKEHVMYVWMDALLNYITGLNIDIKDNKITNSPYWPCNVHVIGKDVLRFHAIYWPIILMSLGLEMPKQIFAHPWVLMNKDKMSKSKGNIIYTEDLVKLFGKDTTRYYVLSQIPYKDDGNLTYELVLEKHNSDLVNTYGNLVNRTLTMVKKYNNKIVEKQKNTNFNETKELLEKLNNLEKEYYMLYDQYKTQEAIKHVFDTLRAANKYIDDTAPWVLAKDECNKEKLDEVLYTLLEVIRITTELLDNVMPSSTSKIKSYYTYKDNKYQTKDEFEIIFSRLDYNKDIIEKI